MTTIGFDVSKYELYGVRTDRSAREKESFQIQNTRESIVQFLDGATAQHSHLLIASEATNEYHRMLAQECVGRNIPFRLLNPILTKQFTRATVRKKKTDLSDALIIAKLAVQGEGTLLTPESFQPLKPITRTERKLVALRQMLKLMETRLETIFPEEHEVVHALAVSGKELERSIKTLRRRSHALTDHTLQRLLVSIPGIGVTIATALIAEIEDINRFSSGKSIVAFAELDPKVRQSGLTLKRNTRITKRGSPYLRRVLYIAASIAQRHDPELKQYFEKKVGEGKRYKEATVAVARKIIYRVYAVWKRKTPYVKYPQKS